MPPQASSSDSPRTSTQSPTGQSKTPAGGGASPLALRSLHRRLARYLYVASLVRGRRVLDIDCGEGQGSTFLVERGAQSVLGLSLASQPSADRLPSQGVTVRTIARRDLLRPEAMLAAVGSGTFDVIFLHATPELITQPFLGELRRSLSRGGHLVVAVRSKETFATAADAVGYFDLFDSLMTAAIGPVTMLGQSPFLGAAVVPFGASDPPLVFDDSLAPPEHPDEYVALCGPPPTRPLPYQVLKLPHLALEAVAPAEKVVERVEVQVDSPQLVAERDRLKAQIDTLTAQLDKAQQEQQVLRAASRGLEERLHGLDSENATHKAELRVIIGRLEEQTAARRAAEATRNELAERLHQRDRGESESTQAALLHEKQMRELRSALEEREAFAAELEEQARELPRLQEQLAAAQKTAEESQRSERQGRQRLAEVEGLLIRARGELQERAQQAQQKAELEAARRELEAARRELLVQREDLEQLAKSHAEHRASVDKAAEDMAKERGELERLRSERSQQERAVSERDAALSEVRQELLAAQERLQHLHAELEQKNRALTEAQSRLERSRIERTAVLAAPNLGSSRNIDSDGVPILVGDMPTAPVPVSIAAGPGAPSLPQEISQLRQRIAELTSENERLKDKITEAERETWKHMKARSEAEQAAAEVREDTVRKLRDARKLASVELTRAMEDATKKAVQLREELARTEVERKDAVAQIKELRQGRDTALEQAAALKQELDSMRWSAAATDGGSGGGEGHAHAQAPASSHAMPEELVRAQSALTEERSARQAAQQAADEAQSRVAELRSAVVALEQALSEARSRAESEQRRVETLEEELRGGGRQPGSSAELMRVQQEVQQQTRSLAERTAERDALARLLAEVEREAAARAERARAMRVRLSEREREVETLRAELYDRERKIAALEHQAPPSEEVSRLEADLQSTRRRISDLLDETVRSEHHGDDAVATALRERARAVRMNEALEQTTRERDEARSRAGDFEQRLSDAVADSERLRAELLRASAYPSANSLNRQAAEADSGPSIEIDLSEPPPRDPQS